MEGTAAAITTVGLRGMRCTLCAVVAEIGRAAGACKTGIVGVCACCVVGMSSSRVCPMAMSVASLSVAA